MARPKTINERIRQEAMLSTGLIVPFRNKKSHLRMAKALKPLFQKYPYVNNEWWAKILGISPGQVYRLRQKK